MNPKQITCARCRKPVESTSWWDDHTTRERVLQARCHGAVDEMRFRPDRLTPEQMRAFSEAQGVAFTGAAGQT